MDKLQHRGRSIYPNGEYYQGGYKNDRYDGFGVKEYSNGDRIEGMWEKGFLMGQATCNYKNGNVYQGICLHGKYEGHGVMKYANGSSYSGEWKNNMYHGQGYL